MTSKKLKAILEAANPFLHKYSMYSLHDECIIMKADTLEELSEYAHNCSISCEWYIVNNFTGERVATHRYE